MQRQMCSPQSRRINIIWRRRERKLRGSYVNNWRRLSVARLTPSILWSSPASAPISSTSTFPKSTALSAKSSRFSTCQAGPTPNPTISPTRETWSGCQICMLMWAQKNFTHSQGRRFSHWSKYRKRSFAAFSRNRQPARTAASSTWPNFTRSKKLTNNGQKTHWLSIRRKLRKPTTRLISSQRDCWRRKRNGLSK